MIPFTTSPADSSRAKPPPAAAPSQAAPSPAEPSTLELAANFAGAMARWSAAGFPTVTAEAYAARAEACDACERWDPKAFLGAGQCRACGCSGLKRWLATAKCPHPAGPRWPA